MYRGYVVRLLPTKEQEEKIKRHAGAARFIWNYMLEMQNENYKNGGKYIDGYGMCKHITVMKQKDEYKWLYEVSNGMLQNVCLNLHAAFVGFFKKRNDYPQRKRKDKIRHNGYQLPKQTGAVYFVDDEYVFIPKIGRVKYKTDEHVPIGREAKLWNPAINYKNRKWRFSFSMPCETQAVELNDFSMGIDLGATPFAAVAYENETMVFNNIFKTEKAKNDYSRLRHLNKMSQGKKRKNGHVSSKNHAKAKEKTDHLYFRIAARQHDYIHKITRRLVELKPKRIVLEDIDVVELSQRGEVNGNHMLRQCWGMFRDTIKYKAEEYGIEVVIANGSFASSQICHNCGHVLPEMSNPNKKRFRCPNCGGNYQRDVNAAINLMNYTA